MPNVIIYGDNISTEPSDIFNAEVWRLAKLRAEEFVKMVSKYGGDATLIILPDIGIKGNTHAPFVDLNKRQIATIMETWIHEKGFDIQCISYDGPQRKQVELTIPLSK